MNPGVMVAAVTTYQRGPELKRLLHSLSACGNPPALVAIADHAPTGEVANIARDSGLRCLVREDQTNPGPGAGWSNAAEAALQVFPDASSILFLDDDVVMPVGSLAILARELETSGAACVAPLLEDRLGQLWAFPEPVDRKQRALIRTATTPSEAQASLGSGPHAFCWCTGACILVDRRAYQKVGRHRHDFFMLGEDLEFSMRLAAAGEGLFTCQVSVPHLPPERGPSEPAGLIKFCCLLQNLSYLAFHSPHSAHMKRYLPGNFRRFFNTYGLTSHRIADGVSCFVAGALLAEPAGGPRAIALRKRLCAKQLPA